MYNLSVKQDVHSTFEVLSTERYNKRCSALEVLSTDRALQQDVLSGLEVQSIESVTTGRPQCVRGAEYRSSVTTR